MIYRPRNPSQGPSSSNLLIRACLWLEASPYYEEIKARARDLLDNPRAPEKRWFDLGMTVLVLASVALLVYSVENPVTDWMRGFEYLAVAVFITEYLARIWIVGDLHRAILEHYRQARFLRLPFRPWPVLAEMAQLKWAYISSPLAIIDLLAILPSYRPVRLLRVFLLFRVFKLFRYARSVHGMAEVLSERRFEFYTLALFMVFVVLAAASAIYVFEGPIPDSSIDTLADAIYWAMVTLSTVGYGDIVPLTPEGRGVAMALILAGIGVLAFSTSIVVTAFQGKLKDLRENRVFSELERGKRYAIICGFGEIGQVVAAKLHQAKQRFVVIEIDADRAQTAAKLGYLSVCGDAADNDLLETIGVQERAHTLICVTDDDVKNVFITVSARRMNDGLRIVARARARQVVRKLTLAGANHVVSPPQIVGLMGASTSVVPWPSKPSMAFCAGSVTSPSRRFISNRTPRSVNTEWRSWTLLHASCCCSESSRTTHPPNATPGTSTHWMTDSGLSSSPTHSCRRIQADIGVRLELILSDNSSLTLYFLDPIFPRRLHRRVLILTGHRGTEGAPSAPFFPFSPSRIPTKKTMPFGYGQSKSVPPLFRART